MKDIKDLSFFAKSSDDLFIGNQKKDIGEEDNYEGFTFCNLYCRYVQK